VTVRRVASECARRQVEDGARGPPSQGGSCSGGLTVGIRRIGSILTPCEGPTGVLTALPFR